MHAASDGNYWPLIAAAIAVLIAAIGGSNAFGLVTRLSRWVTSRPTHVQTDLEPFSVRHLRLVLGTGPLMIAAGLVVLV